MALVSLLDRLVVDHPQVKFGSYPYVLYLHIFILLSLFDLFAFYISCVCVSHFCCPLFYFHILQTFLYSFFLFIDLQMLFHFLFANFHIYFSLALLFLNCSHFFHFYISLNLFSHQFFYYFFHFFFFFSFIDHPDFKTIITVEGISDPNVHNAVNGLLTALPPNAVLR